MSLKPALSGLLLALLLSTPDFADDTSARKMRQASRWTQKADRALQSGDLERAEELYDKALAAKPDWPDGHLGVGHIAMRRERFDRALEAFERTRDGYLAMGHELFREQVRRYNAAQERAAELRILLSRLRQSSRSGTGNAGSDAHAQTRIAQIENEIQQLDTVDTPMEAETPQVPGRVFFFIGNALNRLDRTNEATAAWETCVEREPRFAPVYNNLAVVYWKTGRLREALDSLGEAEKLGLAVNPDFKAELERSIAARPPSSD